MHLRTWAASAWIGTTYLPRTTGNTDDGAKTGRVTTMQGQSYRGGWFQRGTYLARRLGMWMPVGKQRQRQGQATVRKHTWKQRAMCQSSG